MSTQEVKRMDVPTVAQSALVHADWASLAERLAVRGQVLLEEGPLTGLVTLRGDAQQEALLAGVESALDLALPGRLQSVSKDALCLRWQSPDEWLLSLPFDQVTSTVARLREHCTGHMAVVDVSGGFTLLNLSGERAIEVLKKSTGYDVHPANFPPGKIVNTTFAKATVGLRCVDVNCYEIIVRRSYADYLWLWLQSAMREYHD